MSARALLTALRRHTLGEALPGSGTFLAGLLASCLPILAPFSECRIGSKPARPAHRSFRSPQHALVRKLLLEAVHARHLICGDQPRGKRSGRHATPAAMARARPAGKMRHEFLLPEQCKILPVRGPWREDRQEATPGIERHVGEIPDDPGQRHPIPTEHPETETRRHGLRRRASLESLRTVPSRSAPPPLDFTGRGRRRNYPGELAAGPRRRPSCTPSCRRNDASPEETAAVGKNRRGFWQGVPYPPANERNRHIGSLLLFCAEAADHFAVMAVRRVERSCRDLRNVVVAIAQETSVP